MRSRLAPEEMETRTAAATGVIIGTGVTNGVATAPAAAAGTRICTGERRHVRRSLSVPSNVVGIKAQLVV